MKNISKIILAALITVSVSLVACDSTAESDTETTVELNTTAVETQAETQASGTTSVEKTVVFETGTNFSGSKRIAGEYTGQYLSTDPVDSAISGKLVYTVNNENAGKLTGSKVQTAGAASSAVTAKAELGYKFIGWSDGKTEAVRSGDTDEGVYTAIFDYDVLDMPIVVVNTDSGKNITSKEEYADSTISVLGCEDKYVIESAVMGIRGRGNNSWGYPKKSYKFKLAEKTNIFGLANGDEKIWVLLANQCDQSLQRNHVSFELGRYFSGIEWQPNSASVELYLNGEYVGVYLLAEEIRVSGDRVDIEDTKLDEIDTGYLLELSNYSSGEVINAAGRAYMIQSDLSEDNSIKREQRDFIENYVNECYDALVSGDQAQAEKLIDLDSLVACYLTEETVKNLDSQWDSFYLSKDAGGKLVFGPMWDFDLSLGNANEGAEEYSDIFVGNGRGSGGGITWFSLAMLQPWFRQMVVDKWLEIYDSISLMPQFILDEGELGFRSYERNFIRWDIFGTVQNRETYYVTRLRSYEEHYKYLAEWLTNRLEWLNNAFTVDTFIADGTGLYMVNWGGWGGGGGGGQNGSSYGNDETEELADKYDSLSNYIKDNTATGPDGFDGEGVNNLFDNDRNTKYCVEADGEIVVEVQLKKATEIKAYMLRTGNDTADYVDRNPDSWTLYGSMDGSSWTVISEEPDGSEKMGAENQKWYGFEAQNTEKYKFYRFEFINSGIMQLAEIRFLG